MRIQDSNYYQDYSYVVRIGESINQWRESVRRSVHPAGWNVFGEVSFASQVAARIQNPAAGSVRDSVSDDTFTPELASTFTNLFTVIFGRRLGTKTDGTTLRSNPTEGTSELLPSGKREVTLTSAVTVRMGEFRQSNVVTGPTLNLLPQYAFSVPPTDTSEAIPHYPGLYRTAENGHDNRAYYNIDQFGQYRINQLSDSSGNIPLAAFNTRINVPPPGEIKISSSALINAFDNTFKTFDSTTNLFDEEGTPRQTSGSVYASYDEDGTTFDRNSKSFDEGQPSTSLDMITFSFDENTHTFDQTV